MKTLTITDQRGLKLAALYDEPASDGPFPLVILLHGNTGWKEEDHLTALAADLTASGIAALRFDAPGSGKSEGTWDKDYRVSNFLADVSDVCSFALQNFNIDPARLGIWGHSLGGMVAVYAATHQPNFFKAICGCEATTGDMSMKETVGDTDAKFERGVSMATEIFGVIHLPADYFHDRQKYNTVTEIKELHTPLLLIAGTKDDIVPAAEVRRIFEAANEPKHYLEFPTDHYYKRDPLMLSKINAATVAFFREHLSATDL